MSINRFSSFVRQDISKTSGPEEILGAVGDNFLELALTGNLSEDVLLVKQAQGDAPTGGLLPLRLANGRLVSAFTLSNLLTIKMQEIAGKKMGKAGRLVNRTGRLLRSSRVDPNIINTDNTVSLQFKYMFAPYEVFDPKADVVTDGGAMKSRLATIQRNPRKLFREALREAAKLVLYKGYKFKVAQVGVSKR